MKKVVRSVSCIVIALLLAVGFGIPSSKVKAASPLDGTVLIGNTAFTINALIYCKPGDKVYNDIVAKLRTSSSVYVNLSGNGWQDAFTSGTIPESTVLNNISVVSIEDANGNITQYTVGATSDDLTVIDIS